LRALVEPTSEAIPCHRRVTAKSTRRPAEELTRHCHRVCAGTVADLLCGEGFSLQGNAKTIGAYRTPDRAAQFRYLTNRSKTTNAKPIR
jgi:hypothetical protein